MGNLVAATGQSEHKLPEESRVVTRNELRPSGMGAIEDPNLCVAIHSLDALISKVLHEKAVQGQQQQQKASDDHVHRDNELATAFASLATVLHGQIEASTNSTEQHRRPPSPTTAVMSAPLYKCPMDSNRHQENNAACKVNYKNLFPRSSAETVPMDAIFSNGISSYHVEDISSTSMASQRRFSAAVNFGEAAVAAVSGTSPLDTIRINLPEILDQQDEITILRLLIKLLSSKVTKLSDEKRRLLANVSVLSDINAEMAAIIEQGIQK